MNYSFTPMQKPKSKIVKITKRVAIMIAVLADLYIGCFVVSFFATSGTKTDTWRDLNLDKITSLPMEVINMNHTLEYWDVVYDFPSLIPSAILKVDLLDNSTYSVDDIRTIIQNIALESDERVGGNRSTVIVEHYKHTKAPAFAITIKKKCLSPFQVY